MEQKRDRSVKRVKSYSKWSEIYSTLNKFHSISSKILLSLQSDPLFTPYGVIIFLQCNMLKGSDNLELDFFF